MIPKPLFGPKIKRREKRRKVTLVAGMVCRDSIVFAADSEESGGITKSSVEKMRQIPEGGFGLLGHDPKRESSLVVSGAGNGTLADYAMQRIIEQARQATTQFQALKIIKDILIDIAKVDAPLLPVSDPLEAEFQLLIGIRSPDGIGPYLYSAPFEPL